MHPEVPSTAFPYQTEDDLRRRIEELRYQLASPHCPGHTVQPLVEEKRLLDGILELVNTGYLTMPDLQPMSGLEISETVHALTSLLQADHHLSHAQSFVVAHEGHGVVIVQRNIIEMLDKFNNSITEQIDRQDAERWQEAVGNYI